MFEWAVIYKLIGSPNSEAFEAPYTVRALTKKEALKEARRISDLEYTVVDVEKLGRLNPDFKPEEALTKAIYNQPYEVPRYIRD